VKKLWIYKAWHKRWRVYAPNSGKTVKVGIPPFLSLVDFYAVCDVTGLMVLDNLLDFFFNLEKMPTGLTAMPSLTYLIVEKVSPILINPE
jgi:hypothetical protein